MTQPLDQTAMSDWRAWQQHLTDQAAKVVGLLEQGRYLDAQSNYEELIKALEVERRRGMLEGAIAQLGAGNVGP